MSWKEAFKATRLYGVWPTKSATWFAAYSDSFWRYDGKDVENIQGNAPMNVMFDALGGRPSTDEVWAVGSGGNVGYWNGSAWTFANSTTTEPLWGVWATP